MIRVALGSMIAALLVTSAVAQGVIYNPNSPRGRREAVVHPPAPAASSSSTLGAVVVPEKWGSLSGSWPAPAWGTIGGAGWTGTATPTWQVPR
jgi:hypothetical protein